MSQHQFTISVIIKHDSRELAQVELIRRLNQWFNEKRKDDDGNRTLLLWTLSSSEKEEAREQAGSQTPASGSQIQEDRPGGIWNPRL